MPTLLKEDLNKIINLFGLEKKEYKFFVETGTYMGETILRFEDEFEKLYTIELSDSLHADFIKKNYNKNKIISILGDSSEKLKDVIDNLNDKTIFFLDGHYSSCGTAKGKKDVPLYEELEKISKKMEHESIIIIDDLRLFGTNLNEDWVDINKESLLDILGNRVEGFFEENDRFIIKIKKINL